MTVALQPLRRFAVNLALTLAALTLTLAVIELVLFPAYLPVMPTNVMSFNERFGQQLAQSSKAGVVPKDWILLTGDSYSVGIGDALNEAPPGSRDPYGSAHFIARALGRDVMSIGNGGWSNVSAALALGSFAQQAHWSLRYPIEPPALILVYFYEGNDLEDNAEWARLRFGADFATRLYTADEIDDLLDRQRRRERAWGPTLVRVAMANLPATFFMAGAVKQLLRPVRDRGANSPDNAINRAAIGGALVTLRPRLQGPALNLDATAWSNSVLTARSALKGMAAVYPGVPIAVVYVPSPLASYELASPRVSFQTRGPAPLPGEAAADSVRERSLRLRTEICAAARDLGYGFIDAAPAIQAAGRTRLIHGPRDLSHFSLDGYRVLGETVAAAVLDGTARHPPPQCKAQP